MVVNSTSRDATKLILLLRDNQQLSLLDMAGRMKCSKTHVEVICSSLRKAGIIASVHGRNGGYRLAREPGEISFYDIIKATDARFDKGENNHVQEQVINSFKNITMENKKND